MATTLLMPTPFSISPDPAGLYLTPAVKTTIYKTRYTIDSRQGLAAILGDVGLGKSTIMRYVFSRVSAQPQTNATFIPTPGFRSGYSMLKKICQDFGIDAARSEMAQQEAFEKFALEQYEAGMNIVLFIDEAQRMKIEQLEVVRTLLNFETSKAKLVQIVLAGQLELRDKLLTKKYKPLWSRIFAPSLLVPLEFNEMVAMLKSRCDLEEVAWPFEEEQTAVLKILYRFSGGVPRAVLKTLQLAYSLMNELGRTTIDTDLINGVIQSLDVTEPETDGEE